MSLQKKSHATVCLTIMVLRANLNMMSAALDPSNIIQTFMYEIYIRKY